MFQETRIPSSASTRYVSFDSLEIRFDKKSVVTLFSWLCCGLNFVLSNHNDTLKPLRRSDEERWKTAWGDESMSSNWKLWVLDVVKDLCPTLDRSVMLKIFLFLSRNQHEPDPCLESSQAYALKFTVQDVDMITLIANSTRNMNSCPQKWISNRPTTGSYYIYNPPLQFRQLQWCDWKYGDIYGSQ